MHALAYWHADVAPVLTAGAAEDGAAALRRGAELAAALRAAAGAQLQLTVSVGVAPNKLLAKLASRAAKPDSLVVVLDNEEAIQRLLAPTPIERLPGMGGKVAGTLAGAGIKTVADLQRCGAALLETLPWLKPGVAAQLLGWCRGRDEAAVVDKGPPKSLQVHGGNCSPSFTLLHGKPFPGLIVIVLRTVSNSISVRVSLLLRRGHYNKCPMQPGWHVASFHVCNVARRQLKPLTRHTPMRCRRFK